MKRAWFIAAILAASGGLANAEDKERSRALYEKGKAAYAAGRFADAIAQFELAYRAYPASAYLQNIAQAHRRLEHCPEALTYFERFLAAEPSAPNRTSIEAQIAALRGQCGKPPAKKSPAPTSPAPVAPVAKASPSSTSSASSASSSTAPTSSAATSSSTSSARIAPAAKSSSASTSPASSASTSTGPIATASNARSTSSVSTSAASKASTSAPTAVGHTAPPRPVVSAEPIVEESVDGVGATAWTQTASRWSMGATAGVSFLGAGPVVMPPLVQVRVAGRYRTGLPYGVHAGLALDVAPLPYDDASMGTAWLAGGQLAVDASYPVTDRIAAVGALGLGARVVAGLDDGNPFTTNSRAADAFALFVGRVEVGAAWHANERMRVRVPVSYEYSPRRGPLASDIGALRGFAIAAGLDLDL